MVTQLYANSIWGSATMLDNPTIKSLLEVGGLIFASFGTGYVASQALMRTIVQNLRDDKDRLREQLSQLRDLPDRISKLEADKSGLERKRDELSAENSKLHADL